MRDGSGNIMHNICKKTSYKQRKFKKQKKHNQLGACKTSAFCSGAVLGGVPNV
jgi:hypothetical protein